MYHFRKPEFPYIIRKMKPLKILVVTQHFYPESFRINDICFSLVKRGHEVTVLTGLPNYPEGKIYEGYRHGENREEVIQGVKVVRSSLVGRGKSAPQFGVNYAWFAYSASQKAKTLKSDFDVIYSFQTSPVSMVFPAITVKKEKKIPLVVNCLDQWPISVTTGPIKKDSAFYNYLKRMSIKAYSQADCITITSKAFRTYFEEELHLAKERYGFLYWPQYAEELFQDIPYEENGVFDLVYAGNIGPATNTELIVEVAALLKEYRDIHFHIVGSGMNKEACEQGVRDYELENITFYGAFPIEEMKSFYQKADAFLITMQDHPVVNSTLPGKTQSYLATGKPILGSISGECQRVIEESSCGYCANAEDLDAFYKVILKAYHNQELLKQMGKQGKQYYEDHFNKEKLLDRLEEILWNVVKQGVRL